MFESGSDFSTPPMRRRAWIVVCLVPPAVVAGWRCAAGADDRPIVTRNEQAGGYRGIWYMNQPSGDQYVYKYSGGLGTYCAKHKPFAVYRPEANKTFFCYGGAPKTDSRRLLHMVSYFDHATGTVPRPTLLLNKQTSDAHDNPVLAVDDIGHIWIFSTSHGTARPSYIHRSRAPYRVDAFDRIRATRQSDSGRVPIDNFSYMQAWYVPGQGFQCFFTRYGYPAPRTICFMSSRDGVSWSAWQRLAAIEQGHYQVSAVEQSRAGTAFNMHPSGKGLNWRTNLYYLESRDGGRTWQTVDGRHLSVPLRRARNDALVADYQSRGLNVYLKDIRFDRSGQPVILFLTSQGYQSGPQNNPRTWTTARWDTQASRWTIRPAMTSDNNYDMGSLWIAEDGTWTVIAPTDTGPQPFNPGGEVVMWRSVDQGETWHEVRRLTSRSRRNHTYIRRPVNAHREFFALWADGHGRRPSESDLFFCNSAGDVFRLPRTMDSRRVVPPRWPADDPHPTSRAQRTDRAACR